MIEVDFEYEAERQAEAKAHADDLAAAAKERGEIGVLTRQRRAAGRSDKSPYRWRKRLVVDGKGRCQACDWAPPSGMEDIVPVHHVTPLACGGSHDEANLVLLCPNCHAVAHKLWPIFRINRFERDYYGPKTAAEIVEALRAVTYPATTTTRNTRGQGA